MFGATQMREQNSVTHAVARDFCRIFKQDMDRLYLLSFLLTANEATAEKCFVGGLEDSARSPRVFKEWAQSWARRMIVQNAIQMIRPQPDDDRAPGRAGHNVAVPAELARLVELPAFDRFVFVMSVLERYTDQDCARLLDSTREEVIVARSRALQELGHSVESPPTTANIAGGSGESLTQEVAGLLLTLVPRLVPST